MIEEVTVPARSGLDPVTAYFHDLAPGRGRAVLICYDMSYQVYWGAMGDMPVKEFFASCGVDYICGRMVGMHYKSGKADLNYMKKVVSSVHEFLNNKENTQ